MKIDILLNFIKLRISTQKKKIKVDKILKMVYKGLENVNTLPETVIALKDMHESAAV